MTAPQPESDDEGGIVLFFSKPVLIRFADAGANIPELEAMREKEAGQQIADAPACVPFFWGCGVSFFFSQVTCRAQVTVTSMADLDKDLSAQGLVSHTVLRARRRGVLP